MLPISKSHKDTHSSYLETPAERETHERFSFLVVCNVGPDLDQMPMQGAGMDAGIPAQSTERCSRTFTRKNRMLSPSSEISFIRELIFARDFSSKGKMRKKGPSVVN